MTTVFLIATSESLIKNDIFNDQFTLRIQQNAALRDLVQLSGIFIVRNVSFCVQLMALCSFFKIEFVGDIRGFVIGPYFKLCVFLRRDKSRCSVFIPNVCITLFIIGAIIRPREIDFHPVVRSFNSSPIM